MSKNNFSLAQRPIKGGRICEVCHKPHQNRIVNRCHLCRLGKCDICSIEIDPKYKKCLVCQGTFF